MLYKIVLIPILFLMPLCAANTVSARYDVTFSVFGKIGEAFVRYEHDDTRYRISVDGGLTGSAASIGQNRRELHESFGHYDGGVLVPELYRIVRQSDHYRHITLFVFDQEARTITRYRERNFFDYERRFDMRQMKIVKEKKARQKRSENLVKFYAENDLLSLFFNVCNLLQSIPEGEEKLVYAAGGSNKEGKVIITNPGGEKRKELKGLMPRHEDRIVTVIVDQDIFESDRGELYVSLDADYLAIEAMLKDVLLFGDIHAYRVWQEGGL